MANLSVLFIGGTGVISSACVPRALEAGMDVTILNRGQSSDRSLPATAQVLHGDIRNPESVRKALAGKRFDVVVDFVAFTTEHIQTDIDLFAGQTGQFVFISSASAYQKPPAAIPVLESTPLRNPFWQYSRDKIACEDLLVRAYREDGFPITIVRPSHTYDRTKLPCTGGWTVIDRMRRGEPVVVHGDGTSRWPITHHDDFARAFVGLLGAPQAIGDSYHITTDEALTWDQIHHVLAAAAGAPEPTIVHASSDLIALIEPAWGPPLLGDKAHSMLFDNSKVRRVVPDWAARIPYVRGAREVLAWYDADPARKQVDDDVNKTFDRIIAAASA